MNKWTKIALAAVAITTISALTLTPSYAQNTTNDGERPGIEERIRNFAQKNFGRWHSQAHEGKRGMKKQSPEVIAEALGITVEDLQTASEAGKSIDDLLAEQGLDQETFEANLKTAIIAQINQKVADGEMTQEKADAWIAKIESGELSMNGRGHGKGHSKGHSKGHGKKRGHHNRGMEQKTDVVAEALGITVEDLQAAREEGKTLADLQAELGIDDETFQANLKAAAIAQVNQMLADGDISQEKADAWIEKIESSEFNMNGRGHGRGHGKGFGKGHHRGDHGDDQDTEESDTDGDESEDEQSADAGSGDTLFRLTTAGQAGDMSVFLPMVSGVGQ